MMKVELKGKNDQEQEQQNKAAELVSAQTFAEQIKIAQQQAKAWEQLFRKKEAELEVVKGTVQELNQELKVSSLSKERLLGSSAPLQKMEFAASADAQQHEGVASCSPQGHPGELNVSPTTAAGGFNATPQTRDTEGAGLRTKETELKSSLAIQSGWRMPVLPVAARRSVRHAPESSPPGLSPVENSEDSMRLPLHLENPEAFAGELPSLLSQKNWLLLVQGVHFHIDRVAVVAAGLGAVLALLWGTANNRENAGPAFHAGVLSATFAAMRKHGNELAVIQTACYVLWSINADSPEEALIRTETAAGGGLPLLFAALDTFGTVGKVANAALVALINVINNNPTNQLTFIELGGVEKMLGLVNHDDILIQKKAIRALLNFLEHDRVAFRKMAMDRLTALDVETPVKSAMNRHAATSDTKEWGQKLLSNHRVEVARRAVRTGSPEIFEREISKMTQSSTHSSSGSSSSSDEEMDADLREAMQASIEGLRRDDETYAQGLKLLTEKLAETHRIAIDVGRYGNCFLDATRLQYAHVQRKRNRDSENKPKDTIPHLDFLTTKESFRAEIVKWLLANRDLCIDLLRESNDPDQWAQYCAGKAGDGVDCELPEVFAAAHLLKCQFRLIQATGPALHVCRYESGSPCENDTPLLLGYIPCDRNGAHGHFTATLKWSRAKGSDASLTYGGANSNEQESAAA